MRAFSVFGVLVMLLVLAFILGVISGGVMIWGVCSALFVAFVMDWTEYDRETTLESNRRKGVH